MRNGRPDDKLEDIEQMVSEGARLIEEAKWNYFLKACKTLANLVTSSKSYKIPVITPLLENGLFVTDLIEKAQIFNDCFILQCTSIDTGNEIPQATPVTKNPMVILSSLRKRYSMSNIIRSTHMVGMKYL